MDKNNGTVTAMMQTIWIKQIPHQTLLNSVGVTDKGVNVSANLATWRR